uniref:Uncharacterized protein n=1 Tax=Hyaloperonospora arabidopsidis (strain Emoy2) TaxID=559515 RepID=M4C3G5_HYAAE
MDGSVIGAKSVITAGSIVTQDKQVPSGQLWSGVPARYLRDLTAEEMHFMQQCSAEYTQLAEQYAVECAKSFEDYFFDCSFVLCRLAFFSGRLITSFVCLTTASVRAMTAPVRSTALRSGSASVLDRGLKAPVFVMYPYQY